MMGEVVARLLRPASSDNASKLKVGTTEGKVIPFWDRNASIKLASLLFVPIVPKRSYKNDHGNNVD